jgi:hypothetical protein
MHCPPQQFNQDDRHKSPTNIDDEEESSPTKQANLGFQTRKKTEPNVELYVTDFVPRPERTSSWNAFFFWLTKKQRRRWREGATAKGEREREGEREIEIEIEQETASGSTIFEGNLGDGIRHRSRDLDVGGRYPGPMS